MSHGFLTRDSMQNLTAMSVQETKDKTGEQGGSTGGRSGSDSGGAGTVTTTGEDPAVATIPIAANPQEEEVVVDTAPVSVPTQRQQQQERDGEEGSRTGRKAEKTITVVAATGRTSSSSYGRYTGFHSHEDDVDFDYYENYHHATYAPLHVAERDRKTSHFSCWCLFPWMQKAEPPLPSEEETFGDSSLAPTKTGTATDVASAGKETGGQDEDELSHGSDALGEKLTDKEQKAVLARIGLAQPDTSCSSGNDGMESSSSPGGGSSHQRRGLLNGIPTYDSSPLDDPLQQVPTKPLRGILKHRSSAGVTSGSASGGGAQNNQDAGSKGQQRRSLFPSYGSDTGPRRLDDLNVSFAPLARVVTVKSKNDMTPSEKADIWWQREDYEDFRKTGRIITKAMLQGGSEIWLSSNEDNAVADNSNRRCRTAALARSESERPATLSKNASMSRREESVDDRVDDDDGNKWWHKFGHSRRGLEHVVSQEEGKQRQQNVKNAIRSVLDEQGKQRLYRREDPEKLRIVSLNHTTWARDLALASGQSDRDAVSCSFAEDRKTREFFLLKMARTNPSLGGAGRANLPAFMVPTMQMQQHNRNRHHSVQPDVLDANTAAQIRYRRKRSSDINKKAAAEAKSESTTSDDGAAAKSHAAPAPPRRLSSGSSASVSEGENDHHDGDDDDHHDDAKPSSSESSPPRESSEPIHDPKPDRDVSVSMKQKAAGFLPATGCGEQEKVNMAAVLSGRGAVPQDSSPSAVTKKLKS